MEIQKTVSEKHLIDFLKNSKIVRYVRKKFDKVIIEMKSQNKKQIKEGIPAWDEKEI